MKLQSIRTYIVGNPPSHYGGRYFIFVKPSTGDALHLSPVLHPLGYH